jgi:nitric oxide reductase activation protein
VKSFTEPIDAATASRIASLQSQGSTRLGAVLRHATRRLPARRGAQRWALLLSDGSPHDIDVHDPVYLVEDARRALSSAARHGVRIGCLVFEPGSRSDAARIFGRHGAASVHALGDLPDALRCLLA